MSAEARERIAQRSISASLTVSRTARQRACVVDLTATIVMSAAALLLVVVLLGVIFILLRAGLPALSWTFLTTAGSFTQEGGGIGPQIFVTIYILVLALLIATPLGVAAAIYLAEYAPPGRLTTV